MNAPIPCQFAAPTEFRCIIRHRAPRPATRPAPIWKPVLCRVYPGDAQTERFLCIPLELDFPKQPPTKANS